MGKKKNLANWEHKKHQEKQKRYALLCRRIKKTSHAPFANPVFHLAHVQLAVFSDQHPNLDLGHLSRQFAQGHVSGHGADVRVNGVRLWWVVERALGCLAAVCVVGWVG